MNRSFNWKKFLLLGVGFLFVSCCVLGQLVNNSASKNSSSPNTSNTTDAKPKTTPTENKPIPTYEPLACGIQIKNYASAMRSEVFPNVFEADAESERGLYSDAQYSIYLAKKAFEKISVPSCDADVIEHAGVYKKMLDEYWNAYAFADNDELHNAELAFSLATVHRSETSRIMGKIINK